MGRFRGIVLSAMLVIASIGVGVALAQAQADGGAPAGAAPPAGAPGPGAPAAGSPAAATAPWTSDVPRATALLSRLHHAAAREMLLGDRRKRGRPPRRHAVTELSSAPSFAPTISASWGSRPALASTARAWRSFTRARTSRPCDASPMTSRGSGTPPVTLSIAGSGWRWRRSSRRRATCCPRLPRGAPSWPGWPPISAQVIDGASLRALYVARAQQPAGQSNQVKQVSPTR